MVFRHRARGTLLGMERSAWTDARLDDRFDQIYRRFDQVDRRLDSLESEMRNGFASVSSDIGGLRNELGGEIGGVRSDLARLQTTMIRSYAALAIALVAAIVVRGI
jgi:hypothetical protein